LRAGLFPASVGIKSASIGIIPACIGNVPTVRNFDENIIILLDLYLIRNKKEV
jgi:hypothetical protein